MSLLAGIAGAAGASAISNIFGMMAGDHSRAENYRYGEMQANNADARTRRLYRDLYSIPAQMNQLKQTGLSPSLYYGEAGGLSGQSGAMGGSAAGQNQVFGIDPLTMSQIQVNNAQANKLKADEQKTNADTENVNLQNEIDRLRNYYQNQEFQLVTAPMTKEDGSTTSTFEIATNANSYGDFVNELRKAAEKSGRNDLYNYFSTEKGQEKLRDIYLQANRNERDINVLAAENVDAQFKQQVTTALMSKDFAELNADEAIKRLETNISQSELTGRQKEAWNNLLRDLEKRNKTAYEIVVILGMLVDRFAGHVNTSVKK